MGALLTTTKPAIMLDKLIFLQLKRNQLKDLNECIEVIIDQYPHHSFIRFEEFDDIFAPLLPDTEPLFTKISEYNSDKENIVDIYECLSVFALFSGEEFEKKAWFIFKLFDFNHSDTIELSELVLTINSVVRVLCKIAGLNLPPLNLLESLANSFFIVMDKDHNKHIDFEEFLNWILQNQEFQDFLLRYSGTQTINNAKLRYTTLMLHYEAIIASRVNEKNEIPFKELQELLIEEFKKDLSEDSLEVLWDILVESSQDYRKLNDQKSRLSLKFLSRSKSTVEVMINQTVYMEIMKAWAAFSATDINNYNFLSIKELKILLWVYENEEPNIFRLQREMIEIDKDRTETIDRIEWMKHFCQIDTRTGHQVFRSNLKSMFEKYDVDHSGTLAIKEIKMMLRDTFSEFMTKIEDEQNKFNFGLIIDELAFEIVDDLNKDNDYTLNWDEFKMFMDKSMEKVNKLKIFLEENFKK